MNNYRKIKFSPTTTIEQAVNELLDYKNKEPEVVVYGKFNETILYSDTVTMDGAYLELTGRTKAEFDKIKKYLSD